MSKMRFKNRIIDFLALVCFALAICIVMLVRKSGASLLHAFWALPFFLAAFFLKKVVPDFPEIHVSAAAADIEKLSTLISQGVDINSKDAYGQTAILHLFINNKSLKESDKIKYISLILENGLEVNQMVINKKSKATTLDFAIGFGSEDKIINLLREHGAKTAEELGVNSSF